MSQSLILLTVYALQVKTVLLPPVPVPPPLPTTTPIIADTTNTTPVLAVGTTAATTNTT